jgi:hypothetical protein
MQVLEKIVDERQSKFENAACPDDYFAVSSGYA